MLNRRSGDPRENPKIALHFCAQISRFLASTIFETGLTLSEKSTFITVSAISLFLTHKGRTK